MITLRAITVDCGDAAAVAAFWSHALDRPVDAGASRACATVSLPVLTVLFIQVPEGKTAKNRLHLDLAASDADAEVMRLVSFGATTVGEHNEGGYRWVTLADPEGNEFDVFQE